MSDEKTNLGQEPAFPCEHFPQDSTIEGISNNDRCMCIARDFGLHNTVKLIIRATHT